ncbi:MAG: PAS domain S-box protein, partial [Anaerolineales bacterium]|nr:PAS domain S-box protein [Anaerolineales bacterium]
MTSPRPSRKNKADFTPNGETFRLLFANHPTPMWVYDLKTLAFLDVNDAALEKYGYTRDEFLALTIKDIRPAEDVARLINNLKQERPALQHSGEWHHRLKNGQIIEVEITSHTLEFEGYKAALVMVQDITERKQAEEAQRESEARYRDLVENSPDLICTHDLEGNLLFVNEAGTKISGYSNETLLKMNLRDVLAPEVRDRFDAYLAEIQEKGQAHGLMRIQTTMGEIRYLEFKNTLQTESLNAPIVRAMARDVTERKRTEEALQKSEASLQAVLQSTADGILAVGSENEVLYTNQRFVEMWRIPQEVMASKDDSILLQHILDQLNDPQSFLKKVQELYKSKEEGFDTLDFKDGRVFERLSRPLLYGEEPRGRVWSFRDTTERKQTEEALAASDAKLRALVEQVPAIIYTESAETGDTLYISPQVEKLTGYTPAEWVKDRDLWKKMIHLEDREAILAEDDRTNANHEPFRVEYRILTRDGRTLWINNEAVIIKNRDGASLFWQGVMNDITERKLAEEKLRKSEALFASLFHANPTRISITRFEDSRFLDVNETFLKSVGYTREEVVGHTSSELNDWVDPQERIRLRDLLEDRGKVKDFETQLRKKSGDIMDVLISAELIELFGETCILSVGLDITERK